MPVSLSLHVSRKMWLRVLWSTAVLAFSFFVSTCNDEMSDKEACKMLMRAYCDMQQKCGMISDLERCYEELAQCTDYHFICKAQKEAVPRCVEVIRNMTCAEFEDCYWNGGCNLDCGYSCR